MSPPRWYLLIHQIPARPLYLRAKIRKRLTALGAVALKDTVYVLPAQGALLPSLKQIAEETRAGGGEAHVLRADFVDPDVQEVVRESFRRARDRDYEILVQDIRGWTTEIKGRSPTPGVFRARLQRARKRLGAIRAIDFFDAPARSHAAESLTALEKQILAEAPLLRVRNRELVGRTWVTRRGIQVDRIASAWLIRRFLDPKARLRFVDPGADEVRPDEITFDMTGGDFTHESDRCTFETLILRTGIEDPALARVAEIVHDIDIKDGKFRRPEASGVQQVLLGLLMTTPDDDSRLDRGFAVLDDLHQSFSRRLRSHPSPSNRSSRGPRLPKGGRP